MRSFISSFRNRSTLSIIIISSILSASIMWVAQKLQAQEPSLIGFEVSNIGFSWENNKPTAAIPSSWKFIGVSNGDKINTNSLWFQDKDGNIFLVSGFYKYTYFVLDKKAQKLSSQK